MSILPPAVIVWCLAFMTLAQDPLVTAPRAYRREFENDWVRVVRVRYHPREKIASHDHPRTATIYVYLRDSGPVRFIHTGVEKFTVVRPAVKAGGFRLGRRQEASETHEVESLTDQLTEFLRVELKTVAVEAGTFRGRFPPDARPPGGNSSRVRFENGQVRVVHMTCASRSQCDAAKASSSPALFVALTAARFKVIARGAASDRHLEPGETLWVEPESRTNIENTGDVPAELLKIECQTKPAGQA